MRQLILTINLCIGFNVLAFAQAPQGFNYQAVLRDAGGEIIENDLVLMRFTLHQTTANGLSVYQETQSPTTNEFGLVSLVIGQGMVGIGNFSTINWSDNLHFLQVELNIGGGYVDMGTQQLMSVPYAITATDATNAWSKNGNANTNWSENFIGTTDANGLVIRTNNIERMTFRSNSNTTQVGLGTKTPGTIESDFGTSYGTGNLIHIKDTVTSSRLILDFNDNVEKNQLTLRVDDNNSSIRSSGEIPLELTVASGEGLYIEPGGNIGIFTEDPFTTLHVANGGDASLTGNGYIITGDVDGANMVIDNNEIIARDNGASSQLYINGNGGNVAIGQTSSPSWQLTVNGSAAKPGGGSWTATSDVRLKSNIQPFTPGLNEVMKVKPVTYNYIEQTGHDTTVDYVGVIAQDLQKISPFMVSENEMELVDGTTGNYLSVDPSAFTYMLINAMQEQQRKIEFLTLEIEKLKLQNNTSTK